MKLNEYERLADEIRLLLGLEGNVSAIGEYESGVLSDFLSSHPFPVPVAGRRYTVSGDSDLRGQVVTAIGPDPDSFGDVWIVERGRQNPPIKRMDSFTFVKASDLHRTNVTKSSWRVTPADSTDSDSCDCGWCGDDLD